mmetsp:Transcript_2089/g.13494  ORF Transcript_2089/g.13494 Transcript_2089/m.13494 type:complete len:205 (+) Transcript_2089:4401-5015(+)
MHQPSRVASSRPRRNSSFFLFLCSPPLPSATFDRLDEPRAHRSFALAARNGNELRVSHSSQEASWTRHACRRRSHAATREWRGVHVGLGERRSSCSLLAGPPGAIDERMASTAEDGGADERWPGETRAGCCPRGTAWERIDRRGTNGREENAVCVCVQIGKGGYDGCGSHLDSRAWTGRTGTFSSVHPWTQADHSHRQIYRLGA